MMKAREPLLQYLQLMVENERKFFTDDRMDSTECCRTGGYLGSYEATFCIEIYHEDA